MRIGVIAPNIALQAGLRTLLSMEASLSGAFPPAAPEPLAKVVYEGASLAEFIQTAPEVDLLVIVAEIVELAVIQQVLPEEPGRLAILLLSDNPQPVQALAKLPLRGWGVLPLDTSAEELQAALRAIHEGLVVGAPQLFALALSNPQPMSGQRVDPLDESLTERENQVLQLLAHGLANKQIALRLGISEHTVKFHISSIYSKLEATNRTEAVRAGVQRGLVLI
jgi:DNA-binding NarL/FixJ family response regulator